MTERTSTPKFDPTDEEVVAYRSMSVLAVLGLLAGLAAPAAMFSKIFWIVPPAALVLSALALRQIAAQAPNLVGRAAALMGLFMGVAFLVAAPVQEAVYFSIIRREARAFANDWIEAVRQGEVYKAHHLMIEPKRRVSTDGPLAEFYAKSDAYRSLLKTFLNDPLMRTLFALGTQAQYRFYETANETSEDAGDYLESTYAVTYKDEHEQATTFFIKLIMTRTADRSTGRRDWTVSRVEGGVRPPGW
jgi:hypothetical protein